MKKIPMTQEGHEKLKEELQHLKTVERPKVVEAIETARGHGDLSENAEYDAAKERQGFIEGRIEELEGKIANARVIDPSDLSGDTVKFGATVTLFDFDDDEEKVYQIVGDDEADVKEQKISYSSPIAQALIGERVESEVTIETPGGEKLVEILDVEYK
jgi:transcription elongation factor GreA